MADEREIGERIYPAPTRTHGVVWLLVATAGIAVIVNALSRGIVVVGPYANFHPTDLVTLLASTTPFLTAAAVVVGAGRWQAGRRLLLWGAALLALSGVLDIAVVAWIAWAQVVPQRFIDTPQLLLPARAVLASMLSLAAWVLLAAGLWTGLQGRGAAERGRTPTAAIAVLAAGIVLTAAGIATTVRLGSQGSAAVDIGLHTASVLGALSWTGMALLAAAALWRLPASDRLPELLIAVGATTAMIVAAYQQLMPFVVPGVPYEMLGWAVILPNAVGVLGWAVMIAGFALARIAPRRELVSRQPTPRPA